MMYKYILLTDENMSRQKTKVIATRVSLDFAEILEDTVKRDAYVNLSDLLRDALRTKICRDALEVIGQLKEDLDSEC